MGEEEGKSKVILTSLGQRTKVLSFADRQVYCSISSVKYMLIGIAEEDPTKLSLHMEKLAKYIVKNIESQEFQRIFTDMCSQCLLSLPFKSGVYGVVIGLTASQIEEPNLPAFNAFMSSLLEKVKALLTANSIANHQIVELLVFFSELAHAGVIDSSSFATFCAKAAQLSSEWNFIIAAGAGDFTQPKMLAQQKLISSNCLTPLTSHAEVAAGKGWSPLVQILVQNRAQASTNVDISNFLQNIVDLELKHSFTLNTLPFLKSDSSFLSLKRIATAYTEDSALLATNLRKASNLYFPSQDSLQICYNVLLSLLLDKHFPDLHSVSLIHAIIKLEDEVEEVKEGEPQEDKHITVLSRVLSALFQHLHVMTYSQLSSLSSLVEIIANQNKSEHIWSLLAQKYLKSDVDNPDTRDLSVLSFSRLVFKRLTRSIKSDNLNNYVPASISQLIHYPSQSIQYKYDKEEQLGWTDANIIIDAIKAKCGVEKLQYTLLKQVESTEADLTSILFSVILKLTEKSLEHFRTLYRRYEGILSNEIQKNQVLFMNTLFQAWEHNQWKIIVYTEKVISLNLILPSVVVQVCGEDFQKKAEGLECHNIWFQVVQLAVKMERMLIDHNQRELEKYSSQETEEMEVEVSKYSSFLEGYRGDLEVCFDFVKEMKEWAQENTTNKLLIEFLDSLL